MIQLLLACVVGFQTGPLTTPVLPPTTVHAPKPKPRHKLRARHTASPKFESKKSEVKKPEVKKPELKKAEVKKPEIKEPSAGKPAAEKPTPKKPAPKKPATGEPVAKRPTKKVLPPKISPTPEAPQVKPFVDKPGGYGLPVAAGDIVTIQFLIRKVSGEDVADSKKRGLPYTFKLGAPGNDPLLDLVVKGMKVGAIRTYTVRAKEAYGPGGAPPIIGPNDTLVATVSLLRRGDK